jgi:hypothetical protein
MALRGIMASTLYGPCVEHHSFRRSNNRLSHHTAYIMASVNINGSGKFKSISLMSSRNFQWNALIRVCHSNRHHILVGGNLQHRLKLDKISSVRNEALL